MIRYTSNWWKTSSSDKESCPEQQSHALAIVHITADQRKGQEVSHPFRFSI